MGKRLEVTLWSETHACGEAIQLSQTRNKRVYVNLMCSHQAWQNVLHWGGNR